MIKVIPYKDLGGADHGWLKAKHHFSFASYRSRADAEAAISTLPSPD